MNLDSLNIECKDFIKAIVDCYFFGDKAIKEGQDYYLNNPGAYFHNLFVQFENGQPCTISFYKSKEEDAIEIDYVFSPDMLKSIKGESESDTFFRFINIQRSKLHNKIFLLKQLNEAGLIYLVDDSSYKLFLTSGITEYDKERWREHNKKHYSEIIKSKMLLTLLSEFHNCRIIPSPELIDFRCHKFRSVEKRRFIKTSIISEVAIGVSFIIGILSPFLTTRCTESTINRTQLGAIVNSINQKSNEVAISSVQLDSVLKTIKATNIKTDIPNE